VNPEEENFRMRSKRIITITSNPVTFFAWVAYIYVYSMQGFNGSQNLISRTEMVWSYVPLCWEYYPGWNLVESLRKQASLTKTGTTKQTEQEKDIS
jgi:hypothetical protein